MTTVAESKSEPDAAKPGPALNLSRISHGTLVCKDLEFTRRFYEEFLGLEVIQTSPISLLTRLGSLHTYAVVKGTQKSDMQFLNHNGLDVPTDSEVDTCHRIVVEQAEKWGLHEITKPMVQHGTYSFFFWDADDNCWEILSNPAGGYTWIFEQGDQDGQGHLTKKFERPESTKA